MKKLGMAILGGMLLTLPSYGRDVQKGLFETASVYTKNVNEKEIYYDIDAFQMSKQWKTNGFYYDGNVYKTGRTKANTTISSESGSIDLTKIQYGTNLFVKIKGAFETEYFYDRIEILASVDGGRSYKTIYARTGVSNGEILDYANISEYAGKKVTFKLNLKTDSSIQGNGWEISNFSVVSEKGVSSAQAAPGLRSFNLCSQIGTVNVIDVQWKDKNSGTVAFTIKDGNGQYLTSEQISASDLNIWINGILTGCKEIVPMQNKQSMVDVVYMIDNSGSMSDEQEIVHQNFPDLIKSIGANYDAQSALYRFGFDEDCPFSLEGELGSNFMNPLSSDFTELWKGNAADGSYEGYYAGMIDITERQLNYRPQSQKILIMMGDESATKSDNSKDCIHGGNRVQSEALQALKNAGFQTFILQDKAFENEYSDIINETDGYFGDVKETDYSPIMKKIAEKVKSRIYVKFCLENEISCKNQAVPVELQVCDKKSNTTTTVDYTGAIKRSDATIQLDREGVSPKAAVKIDFEVEEVCKQIESVEVNYSYVDDKGTTKQDVIKVTGSQLSYSVEIPAGLVNPDKIEYNIRVNYTDGMIAASSPIPNNIYDYSWTIPVKKSVPPTITKVKWTGSVKTACGKKTVEAIVVDEDGEIALDGNENGIVYLFYEDYYPNKMVYNNYSRTQMMYNKSTGKYEATLDEKVGSSNGFVYYIYAEDNDGLKGWYGNEQAYEKIVYDEIPLSEDLYPLSVTINFGCKGAFAEGDKLVAYYEGCNGALVEVGRLEDFQTQDFTLEMAINTLENQVIQNGLKETDKIHILLFRTISTDNYWTELGTLDSFYDDEISVCPPISASASLNIKILNEGDVLKVENGAVVTFSSQMSSNNSGRLRSANLSSTKTFSIENDSKEEMDWIINSIKIEPSGNFIVSSPAIRNLVLPYGQTFEFTVDYIGEEDAEADMFIFNNTLTDPFILHLKGESIKKCTDELQNINIYNNSVNVGVKIDGNQSMVNLNVKNQNGQILKDFNNYLGHGVQTLNVPTSHADSLLKVTLDIDGAQCVKEISLKGSENGENNTDKEQSNTCQGLVQSLNINSWGTMINVNLQSLTRLQIEVLNMDGTSTGVKFGPQLMGSGEHELYLGTDRIQGEGVHIVRVLTDSNVCSMPMVNIK